MTPTELKADVEALMAAELVKLPPEELIEVPAKFVVAKVMPPDLLTTGGNPTDEATPVIVTTLVADVAV